MNAGDSTVEVSSHWSAGPVVQCEHLSKRFDRTLALDKVDLSVPAGQMVAVLGLSGSGKSTLLRSFNGLVTPSGGRVEVLGCEVTSANSSQLRALRRQVGFIFQQFGLVGRVCVLENVLAGALGRVKFPRFGVLSYPKSLRLEAFGHLDRVGLADRAFQRADTLSGGQQQRVAIARALMQRPVILLADEPVASLDPESSADVLELMLRVSREDNLTVIASLHQVELARGWADRLVGLRDGRVVADMKPGEVTDQLLTDIYRRVADGKVPGQQTPANVFSGSLAG
jgi:phosphonate transport system ATP-binding protein